MAKAQTVKVKLVKSPIGYPKKHRETLKGLGLSRINQEREFQDTPMLRGMIFKVKHLVISDPPEAAGRP